ncbi:copper-binding protein [Opitutaceae bacterium EW11]|nr:copper-binding protein [Opitutaceae bacterium EW11]
MKTLRLLPLAVLPLSLAAVCFSACSKSRSPASSEATAPAEKAAAARHPLKGVIVDVLPDRSALKVKHEAIPGYMVAMTMAFKVDAATLKAAAKGQAITATLVERDDGLWLEDVQPVR